MKRQLFTERENRLMLQIEHEHDFFKYRMISKQRKDIYEACDEIYFTECVYEYLIYTDELPDDQITALVQCKCGIFKCLYSIYLDDEYIHVDTWDEVSSLIEQLIDRQMKKAS